MKKIEFTKMVASGNDFIVIEKDCQGPMHAGLRSLAKNICNRKLGVGADGLLVLEKSKIVDIKMRIFNADGSEAEMCGNGARCVALYCAKSSLKIETKAGVIESVVSADNVKIRLTDPTDIKLDLPIRINKRILRVNFINTGVPHAVIFVEGLDKIDVYGIGRQIRYHKRFAPHGTNVDFVEVLDENNIKVRTYERGVEDETLACGTGAVASAVITSIKYSALKKSFSENLGSEQGRINVKTQGGEVLKVYFLKSAGKIRDTWLEGKARIVYRGSYML